MSDRFTVERVGSRRGDPVLILLLVLLVGIGLSALFSASHHWANQLYRDPFQLIRRQAVWTALGAAAAFAAARFPLTLLRRLVPVLLVGALGLMLLTFVPGLSEEYLGARRWIFVFGTSFQPSELVKIVLMVYLAHILDRKRDRLDDLVNSVVPPLIVVGGFGLLIYLQNDFSTSMFVLAVSLLLFYVSRVRLRFFAALFTAIVPLSVVLLLTREHRVMRILTFLDPDLDRFGSGYQVLAARTALQNGGIWGRGIGQSLQKFGSLPEPHSDFVFAVFGEEFGYVGVLLVLLLFFLVALRGYRLAFESPNRFRSLLAFGLTSMIVLQAFLNMAVVCGLLPATGIPLPFFSHGGSAVLMALVAAGLLVNVSREEIVARAAAEDAGAVVEPVIAEVRAAARAGAQAGGLSG